MIQANELRVGNALEYFVEDSLAESEWILNIVDADDIALACKDEYFNKYYRPIPLTPEILEKCGFRNYDLIKWDTDAMLIIKNGDGYLYLANQRHVNIFYLHQLQNLYFALTGEELTFKP